MNHEREAFFSPTAAATAADNAGTSSCAPLSLPLLAAFSLSLSLSLSLPLSLSLAIQVLFFSVCLSLNVRVPISIATSWFWGCYALILALLRGSTGDWPEMGQMVQTLQK